MTSYKKKNDLKTALGQDISNNFLFDYLNKKGYHNYTAFPKNKNVFTSLDTIKDKYYVSEIITTENLRKPYLDLEHDYKDKNTMEKDYNKIVNGLVDDIITVFKTKYSIVLTPNDIKLTDNSRKVDNNYKMSLHVVVSPDKCTYYYKSSKNGDESSAYHLYESLVALNKMYKDDKFLDENVYKTEFNLRIIGSSKNIDGKDPLKPINSTTFKQIELNDSEKLHYLLTYVKKNRIQLCTPMN
ncbi:MAG: hypothetical protein EOP34_07865, partial [Rickettsiales bacterium]